MGSKKDKIKVALISPEKSAYSATFIQAHIDLLDADIKHLHGIFFPVQSVDNRYVLKESEFLKKAFAKLRLKRTYKRFFKNYSLAKYLKDEDIQLVLAEFGMTGAEVTDVCEELGIPLIVHFHGNDAHIYSVFKKYGKQYQEMFQYARYIIVVSQYMYQKLKEEGAPENKLVLNPYGPGNDFFSVQPHFDQLHFIAVGRFVEKKAPHLTIKAFQKVYEKLPQARLTLVGDGPLLSLCQQLVHDNDLQDAVTFWGVASHDEVKKLFAGAYCFVQHSVVASNGDSEGTPVAVLEACAAGLPVVATRHAGIQDVILHEETGFLVNEHDVNHMAGYMIHLAQDKNLAKNTGQQGRNRVKENFTMDRHIAVIDDLIKKAIQ